jgi:hypothetical protein
MSVLSKIGGFFKHIFGFFENDAAALGHSAATTIALISPLLNSLVTLTAGSTIAAKVAAVVSQVTSDLNNVTALLSGAEATNPTHSVAGYLQSIQAALPTLLADADVKNSDHAAAIATVVDTVLGEVGAILAVVPAGTAK